MSPEVACAVIEAALVEALLARADLGTSEPEHVARCPDCQELRVELGAIGVALAGISISEAPDELVARTRTAAAGQLRAPRRAAASPPRALPAGFGRELLRLVGGAVLPLPIVVAWNLAVLFVGGEILAPWLPAALRGALGVAYAVAAAGWVALLFGSLPLLAQLGARRRLSEVLR